MPQLNADIYALIFHHIHDIDCLRCAIEAVSQSKMHPLRHILLSTVLERDLVLCSGSEYVEDSESLLLFFLENPHLVQRVHTIKLSRGPRRDSADFFEEDPPVLKDTRRLLKWIPKLLREAKNLRNLSWIWPLMPDEECLRLLAQLESFESFETSCHTGVWSGSWDYNLMDVYWEMGPFCSILGPKLKSLYLRSLNHNVFRLICDNSGSMTKLEKVFLDFTSGKWDPDGRGSPSGPSRNYIFPQAYMALQKVELDVNDIALGENTVGVLGFVETSRLEELTLDIIHCYFWTFVADIMLFSALSGKKFPSLVRLEIKDEVWNANRWHWDSKEDGHGLEQFRELGRAYIGIHEFVSELPALRELWLDERSFLIPMVLPHVEEDPHDHDHQHEDDDDDDDGGDGDDKVNIRYSTSLDENMERTVGSPQWPMIVRTFEKLESLRVGFGPLSARWVRLVLDVCDRRRLRQFGFDFAWKPLYRDDVPLDPDLLSVLASFPQLTDIHILNPRPGIGERRYNDVTIADVRKIFKACPNVFRVGIGEETVWERRTPWNQSEDEDPPVQLLAMREVPKFYCGGSGYYPGYGHEIAEERYDCEKECGLVLELLKSLSS